jgi:tetratricopeptide (TPR) repeat protein
MRLLALLLVVAVLGGCSRSPQSAKNAATPEIAIPEVQTSGLDSALGETIQKSRQALQSSPQSSEAWGKLGQALDAAEFYAEARTCYKRASVLDPQSGRWLHLLAILQLQDQPDVAFTNLARAADLLPATNDAPRLRLAQALVERGKLAEATPHLDALLATTPGHAAARVEMARVKLAAGDPTNAVRLLSPAMTNIFTARAAYLLMSQATQRLGDSNTASMLARRAAAMPRPFDWPDPFLREVQSLKTDEQSLLDRANGLMMTRRLDEAESVLNQVLKKSPDNPEIFLLLGRLKIQQRRCNEAEQALQQHLTLRTNSLQGFMQLGLARFCDSRWSDAASAFQSAVALKPDFAQGHYNLGLALSRAGESNKAIESFHAALRCQPGDASTHAALAEEFLRTGQFPQASQETENALKVDPQQPKALRVRASLLERR